MAPVLAVGRAGYFYPRSPCGERRHPKMSDHPHNTNFYPRSPCGERPRKRQNSRAGIGISIHALLAESDTALLIQLTRKPDFYPRSPCGERPVNFHAKARKRQFLSTLSLRRATFEKFEGVIATKISIHALLAESDSLWSAYRCSICISIHALLAESDSLIHSKHS